MRTSLTLGAAAPCCFHAPHTRLPAAVAFLRRACLHEPAHAATPPSSRIHLPLHACASKRSEEDIGEIQQEIAALKECQSPAITQAGAGPCLAHSAACRRVLLHASAACGCVLPHVSAARGAPCRCCAGHACHWVHGRCGVHRNMRHRPAPLPVCSTLARQWCRAPAS